MGSRRNGYSKDGNYILGIDIGSTAIKCHIYDSQAKIKGSSTKSIELLYPKPGWVELDPEDLWDHFVTVIKETVQASNLSMKEIATLGISTQRATFITWNKKTGETFHNFISWQDRRAADLVKAWNYSFTLKVLHGSSKVLYFLTRASRFLSGSVITFSTQHVSLRLAWVLQNMKNVREAAEKGNCCFGTIDTWLLYKLTKGAVFATDYSNASTTGIFDPYQMCWSRLLTSLLSIPMSIFPPVEDTSHYFGSTEVSIFGVPIPVTALVADQQSAMFGECCFDIGDVKLTIGTGTFMDINTGSKPHASLAGLYPLVGWKFGDEIVFLAEGNAADTGTAIKWAQEIELFSNATETEILAESVQDSDGVCFVPAFNGLQAPLNDPLACASFMGLKPSTTKNHLVRAILESIAFRNKQLYETMLKETSVPLGSIRADGKVCSNSFIMQLTSNLFGKKIDRPKHVDMSCLGATFLAGLAIGFWATKEELRKLRQVEKVFKPNNVKDYEPIMDKWLEALNRSMHWYSKI
ncbi:putative glycerol kinase 5 isoform X1 [Latimeria chalumnae]|nr:PREDICTED: putative glycerol kinase 5 [Latimeria chalumnae]|eukprot:XP_006002852.1 PREDICTED: putative glycerol kinase 5 [Latimeria chalumnae]